MKHESRIKSEVLTQTSNSYLFILIYFGIGKFKLGT